MRKYELMIITVPEIGNEGRDDLKAKITAAIEKEKGTVDFFEMWKEKNKMFHIIRSRAADKRKYDEGTYFLCNFTVESTKLASLKYVLDLDERILRYMNIVKGDVDGNA